VLCQIQYWYVLAQLGVFYPFCRSHTQMLTPAQDPFAYYGISERFTVTRLPAPELSRFGGAIFLFAYLIFVLRAARYIRRTARKGDVPYGRDPLELFFLGRNLARNAVWEAHAGSTWWIVRFCARRIQSPVVAITRGTKDFWVNEGIASNRFLVAPDGFDPREFADVPDTVAARAELQLPPEARIALYTGHLYGWKGASILAQATALLPPDALVVFVGGTEKDVAAFRAQFAGDPHIRIIGHRKHSEIPTWLSAADVLVLPNSGATDLSRLYTSPLKLFEYMASSRPIIASDLPSLREILSEESAYLVRPDDADDLARGIREALEHPEEASARASCAHAQVQDYTWDTRAKRILKFISA